MNNKQRQSCVDDMANSLFELVTAHAKLNNSDDAFAVMSEWIVDGKDPEDGEYEFLFIPDLTATN